MLLHEVQHLIQSYEHFAKGTSAENAYAEFLTAYEQTRRALNAAGIATDRRDSYKRISSGINNLPSDKQILVKRYLALKKIDDPQHAYTVTCLATACPPSLSRREGNRLPYYYKPPDGKVA